jgi:hypothetical protein
MIPSMTHPTIKFGEGADSISLHAPTWGIGRLAQRECREMFGHLLRSLVLRSSVLEHVVSGVFCLAAVNLLAVLTTGGYQVAIGPFVVSAHHLRTPLLLLLALGMIQVWLRGERRGIPTAARLRSPFLLFYMVVLIYSLNGMTLGSGDTVPARYLPLSLLRECNFDLDEFPFLYEPLVPYFLQRLNDHLVSTYPPWAAVLALPLYVLPILGGISSPPPSWRNWRKRRPPSSRPALSSCCFLPSGG